MIISSSSWHYRFVDFDSIFHSLDTATNELDHRRILRRRQIGFIFVVHRGDRLNIVALEWPISSIQTVKPLLSWFEWLITVFPIFIIELLYERFLMVASLMLIIFIVITCWAIGASVAWFYILVKLIVVEIDDISLVDPNAHWWQKGVGLVVRLLFMTKWLIIWSGYKHGLKMSS